MTLGKVWASVVSVRLTQPTRYGLAEVRLPDPFAVFPGRPDSPDPGAAAGGPPPGVTTWDTTSGGAEGLSGAYVGPSEHARGARSAACVRAHLSLFRSRRLMPNRTFGWSYLKGYPTMKAEAMSTPLGRYTSVARSIKCFKP